MACTIEPESLFLLPLAHRSLSFSCLPSPFSFSPSLYLPFLLFPLALFLSLFFSLSQQAAIYASEAPAISTYPPGSRVTQSPRASLAHRVDYASSASTSVPGPRCSPARTRIHLPLALRFHFSSGSLFSSLSPPSSALCLLSSLAFLFPSRSIGSWNR